jgi:hypothetical protein
MIQLFYPDDTVQLIQAMPEHELLTGAEGRVVKASEEKDGQPVTAEIMFYSNSGGTRLTLPAEAVQLSISQSTQQRTAVLWGIELGPQLLVETALHSVLDCGLTMREGLNMAQLSYLRSDRWWKWGDLIRDPSGAQAAALCPTWDGGVVAFSGAQRFQLEFRLKGRRGASLLLHEREAAYAAQMQDTPAALELARVLMSLCIDTGARFCAFPVADAWLMDEQWTSLMRAPYYPDFLIAPETDFPHDYPESFRAARLSGSGVILTALPVTFSPGEAPVERSERDLKLDSLRKCQALGEKYYDQMYESHSGITGLYSSAKDAFSDAISLAKELGLHEEAGKLEARLDHIKNVFRSQFS